MTDETIIEIWKVGRTTIQVAKKYMQEYNKKAKIKKEKKITKDEALAYVEPIIFEYETRNW